MCKFYSETGVMITGKLWTAEFIETEISDVKMSSPSTQEENSS